MLDLDFAFTEEDSAAGRLDRLCIRRVFRNRFRIRHIVLIRDGGRRIRISEKILKALIGVNVRVLYVSAAAHDGAAPRRPGAADRRHAADGEAQDLYA